MQSGTYPLWYSIAIVLFINLLVLFLTYALFYKLRSSAKIKTSRWTAGGAIAGFIILTFLELQLMNRYSPTLESRPSYKSVYSFYNDLQYKRFDAAWNLLHPDLQKGKWHGDIELFKKGYKDTLRISLLAIMLEKEGSPASNDYVVYYKDEVTCPVIPGFEQISSKQLKDFDALANSLNGARTLLRSEKFDVSVFDRLSLYDLMAPNRGARIAWILDNAPNSSPAGKKFEDVFPQKRTVEFISAYEVTTQSTDNGWKISWTTPIILKD
jgi:hypothetical protein